MDRGRVNSWKETLSAGDVAAFERVAGDLLERLGYSTVGASGAGLVG